MRRRKYPKENDMSNKDFLIWCCVLVVVMLSAFFTMLGIVNLFIYFSK